MVRMHVAISGSLITAVLAVASQVQGSGQARQRDRQRTFNVDKSDLADAGRSACFILEPGYRLRFQSGKDTLIVTVLEDTKVVDGVRTRVVEERETSGGELEVGD